MSLSCCCRILCICEGSSGMKLNQSSVSQSPSLSWTDCVPEDTWCMRNISVCRGACTQRSPAIWRAMPTRQQRGVTLRVLNGFSLKFCFSLDFIAPEKELRIWTLVWDPIAGRRERCESRVEESWAALPQNLCHVIAYFCSFLFWQSALRPLGQEGKLAGKWFVVFYPLNISLTL